MTPRQVEEAETVSAMPASSEPGRAEGFDRERAGTFRDRLVGELLERRTDIGVWRGRLCDSDLATAVAVAALSLAKSRNSPHADSEDEDLIVGGVSALLAGQNSDQGWGDTGRSRSNIATTVLAVTAITLADLRGTASAQRALTQYVARQGLVPAIRARYGQDKTFAVPILATAAVAGLVPWSDVPSLPFELAAVPRNLYAAVRMPVVSYAVPALVAIGLSIEHHRPTRIPGLGWLRRRVTERVLAVLEAMQPTSGGYLEAVPLTGFVALHLIAAGRGDSPVVANALRFLRSSVRRFPSRSHGMTIPASRSPVAPSDESLGDAAPPITGAGSSRAARPPIARWPIDTDLATWVTTLAINAIQPTTTELRTDATRWQATFDWLLACQNRTVHPFTGAAPGGWGWTDWSGSVPDADDTPGALLATARLADRLDLSADQRAAVGDAAAAAVRWLISLQNRDGGWPTFCRGWTKLPFDRSGADLTAHVVRALHVWRDRLDGTRDAWTETDGPRLAARIPAAIERGLAYLRRVQRADGAWLPLWFGNQDRPEEDNPIYGTARVLVAWQELGRADDSAAVDGRAFLLRSQNPDGGFGGGISAAALAEVTGQGRPFSAHRIHRRACETDSPPLGRASTIEETAQALDGLAHAADDPSVREAIGRGLDFLCQRHDAGAFDQAAPIGFYFAKLWYYEDLYPRLYTVAALTRLVGRGPDETGVRHF